MAEVFTGQACKLTDETTPLPEVVVPAMAYIPFQQWSETYEPMKGFDRGTIFPCLDKPFYGRRGEPR